MRSAPTCTRPCRERQDTAGTRQVARNDPDAGSIYSYSITTATVARHLRRRSATGLVR